MIIEIIIAVITIVGIWWFFLRAAPPLASQDLSRFKPTNVIQTAPILRKTPVTKKASSSPRDKNKPFVKLFFGSQTGTAEDFAEEVARDLEAIGVSTEVVDLEDYDVEDLAEEKAVLFLMATYGEGEPTDNAKEFWEWLSGDEDIDDLSSLSFGVFGLGNTTYEQYNWFGRQTNKRLLELGAKEFVKYGEGDDDSTLEDDFAAWRKSSVPQVAKFFGLSGEAHAVEYKFKTQVLPAPGVSLEKADSADRFSGKPNKSNQFDLHHPAYASIRVNRELHTEQSDRSCRHVELTLPKTMKYVAGDHLAVWPFNNTELVEDILKRLEIDADQIFVLKPVNGSDTLLGPITARQAFRCYLDLLSIPRKSLLEHLVRYVKDEKEAEKLKSYYETDLYHSYIQANNVSFTDLLREFPSLHIPLEGVMEFLPKLQPRYYSISSAPYLSEDGENVMVDITVAVVEFETPLKRQHKGVCSTWLSITNTDNVAVYIRSSAFKLPKSAETPIIMIGPGTGLAPFRGFLQERAASKSASNILFFGCRNQGQDYIYQEELEKWQQDGHVELHTAFSRDGAEKDYVQHKMAKKEVSGRLWKMISKDDAKIYICGDANKMAKDVRDQWLKIFQSEGGMSAQEAEAYLEGLNDRYQQDTWS